MIIRIYLFKGMLS